MEIQGYIIHEHAQKIPEMTPADYRQLKESIQQDGQTFPITRQNGVIWDGRNRLKACLELGIEPKFEEYAGDKTAAQYILSTNIRRNLSKLQRHQMIADFTAIIYPEIKVKMKERQKSKKGRSSFVPKDSSERNSGGLDRRRQGGDARVAFSQQTGASLWEAQQAKAILENAPELLGEVAQRGGLKNTEREAKKRAATKPNKGAKSKQADARTMRQRREAVLNGLSPFKGLTPQQVDPDFKGSPQDFTDKYGHVQILTKAQREDEADKAAFSAWVGAFRALKNPLREYLKIGKFKVENYHKFIAKAADKEKRIGEMKELADMMVRTRDSIDWLLEELTKP